MAQDNKQCKPWTEVLKVFDPSDFPDATVADAGSSCRNPEFKPMGPYCYTSETDWEYCDIPLCAGKLPNQKKALNPINTIMYILWDKLYIDWSCGEKGGGGGFSKCYLSLILSYYG